MKSSKGFVHIYTGKGKGKTTAAMGLAMRASGWKMNVCVFQFMKKGISGESKASRLSGGRIKIIAFNQTHPIFYHKSVRKKAGEILRKKIEGDLKIVKETLLLGNYDIIILDEIINAIDQKFIKKKEILSLIGLKFRSSELVLTGRGAPKWLIGKADYVTDMRLVKHPYRKGVRARRGIEY
ncbi:MAG: cob(I)yrinic acid a,c-diamide adenosyltransferase [Candidatus Omnitrophica bacterium]|nr:cob(I)yrinic acid a,c-diamide adenosyltransferase [Candidatus Omnitrophota bacterium]